MRILALDVGDKRIGVALSDPAGILASPNTVIERSDESRDIAAIIDIVTHYDAGSIVVGMPFTLRGEAGEQAEKVHAFADHLVKHTSVPVILRDERMTTVSARRLMQESRSKKLKQKRSDDAQAAAVLLQGYLDEKEGQSF